MEAKLNSVFLGVILIVLNYSSALTPFPPSKPEQLREERQISCDSNCFKRNASDIGTIDFVCGSDGFTYLNFGELDCVRKNCRRDIRLKQYGRCPRDPQQNVALARDAGQTENSISPDSSFLYFLSQVMGRGDQVPSATIQQEPLAFPLPYFQRGRNIDAFHHLRGNEKPLLLSSTKEGRKGKKTICIPDECNCPTDFHPICGSDSVTYGNQCLMECNKECNPDVTKYHDGHCGELILKDSCVPGDCGCPDELQFVCGSDSVTYGNRCLLECSKNCNTDLKYIHEGHCGRIFFPKL